MLTLMVSPKELFDEENERFIEIPGCKLELEHSLLAVSKWEARYQVPFLDQKQEDRTTQQVLYYIQCMIQTEDFDPAVIDNLSYEEIKEINRYLNSKESATTFTELQKSSPQRGEVITSELIYYWMVAYTIPFECERWNLNRLFSLLKIHNIKNSPQKKMPRHAIAARNRELNNARREAMQSSG